MWAKQADTRAAKLYSTSKDRLRANVLPALVYGLCYSIIMPTYLERYRSGEYVAVWDQLVALGEEVRWKPIYPDAVAVANETMRRARHNLELLIQRLAEAGYCFIPPTKQYELDTLKKQANPSDPEMLAATCKNLERFVRKGWQSASKLDPEVIAARTAARAAKFAERKAALEAELDAFGSKPPLQNPEVFDPPCKDTAKWLKKLEKAAGGPMPISLRAWFEQVGGVALLGSHDLLNPKENATADPLMVTSPRHLLEMMDAEEADDGMALWIAPDDLHKANISGGDPYIITIPNACADAELKFEWHQTTFVKYLRKAFEWGGFPGWERDRKPPKEAIAKLTQGFLPL
jgi:hypothetical protein